MVSNINNTVSNLNTLTFYKYGAFFKMAGGRKQTLWLFLSVSGNNDFEISPQVYFLRSALLNCYVMEV